LWAFSTMIMAESTIAPMAIAMPPRDMIFEVRCIWNIGRNESRMAMGRVIIATRAERMCQRNTRQTRATTMLSSMSFSRRVEIERLKLDEIKGSLPEGVELVTTYDRSQLIKRSISTLREKLIEESIVVALVCLVFLWHIRSALVAIITLPIAILLSFLPMFQMHLTSNIMSLGGIAIAIGAMVDSAIIMVENA